MDSASDLVIIIIAPPQCRPPFVTCEVNGDAAPPDIRQQTDGKHARHGTLVIMYIDKPTFKEVFTTYRLIRPAKNQVSRVAN